MTKQRLRGAGKFAAISLALAAAVAMPLSASAHGWGGHGGYHGGYGHYDGGRHGYYGGHYRHSGYWGGGRWIAGAIVTGAVVGLVADAMRPAPVYDDRRVVYGPPPTVIYEYDRPVVTRRVVRTRTVIYDDPYRTRYIRDDGYDHDDGDD
ncbi:MAG: hypothetical protein EPN69_01695 [Rhodanobacter sp.]|nr:MAG: hypothetical protein EPN71_09515 [Rhodanobacter sp.]TAL98611.1 MAG: hypothetical protein EPN69_01695 [Rhodanobacter sp.]TAM41572.1 MAG: hypothetical protein EPN58_06285 [Rhodanobacter sp.]TAN28321.1 MAG: hypothetical protein EPN32_03080 [Rhodanobacter sp.]